MFGASFYDQEFAFERRAVDANKIAIDNGYAQLKKDLPVCLTLSNTALKVALKTYLADNPSGAGRRKRSADFMRRFEGSANRDAREYISFERRSKEEDEKSVVNDLNKLFTMMSQEDVIKLIYNVNATEKEGTDAERDILEEWIKFTRKCAQAKAARRLFALRQLLEDK